MSLFNVLATTVYRCLWELLLSETRSIFSFSMFRFVVLVSGLNIGSAWFDQLSIQMLVDYITGQAGGPQVSVIKCSCACVVVDILSRIE